MCPSVRLRQLYIPLQPVHLTKQEVCAFELFLFEKTNMIALQKLIEAVHSHEIRKKHAFMELVMCFHLFLMIRTINRSIYILDG